jgi:hypothetical protein
MSITATVKTPSTSVVGIIKNPLTGPTNNPVTIKSSLNYIHSLLDVSEFNPQDGDTLVYNVLTKKYDVKPMPLQNTNLDGGNF